METMEQIDYKLLYRWFVDLDATLTHATGTAEREARHGMTLGTTRKTAMDRHTLRHPGYQINQRISKRIDDVFAWVKQSAGLTKAKVKPKSRPKVEAVFTLTITFTVIAYNLIRIPKLLIQT